MIGLRRASLSVSATCAPAVGDSATAMGPAHCDWIAERQFYMSAPLPQSEIPPKLPVIGLWSASRARRSRESQF